MRHTLELQECDGLKTSWIYPQTKNAVKSDCRAKNLDETKSTPTQNDLVANIEAKLAELAKKDCDAFCTHYIKTP
ncbi:hypothetical protein NHP190012_13610 [Helicobacter sp. NHP19-012]|uniref:Uncharacterized protein n=1 Tax=Helicobacter gastrofelis TaxID=2849642 RepID=A0ABM7SIH4_9HELI|nr:hypothetical protein NHP190012_13610 [Helicobacter sp. NHP19-012]